MGSSFKKKVKKALPVLSPALALSKGITDKVLGGLKPHEASAPDRNPFKIGKEIKPTQDAYNALLAQTQATQGAVAPLRAEVLQQMGQAALGQAPSLADAQMKAAQDRSLAQQVASLTAARSGSAALNQRAMLQALGAQGNQIGIEAGQQKATDRDQFLNQANIASQNLRTDIGAKSELDLANKKSLQNWAIGKAAVDSAAAQRANQMLGAMIGATGAVVGKGFESGRFGGTNTTNVSGGFTPTSSTPNVDSSAPAYTHNPGFLKRAEGGLVTKDPIELEKRAVKKYLAALESHSKSAKKGDC